MNDDQSVKKTIKEPMESIKEFSTIKSKSRKTIPHETELNVLSSPAQSE